MAHVVVGVDECGIEGWAGGTGLEVGFDDAGGLVGEEPDSTHHGASANTTRAGADAAGDGVMGLTPSPVALSICQAAGLLLVRSP